MSEDADRGLHPGLFPRIPLLDDAGDGAAIIARSKDLGEPSTQPDVWLPVKEWLEWNECSMVVVCVCVNGGSEGGGVVLSRVPSFFLAHSGLCQSDLGIIRDR